MHTPSRLMPAIERGRLGQSHDTGLAVIQGLEPAPAVGLGTLPNGQRSDLGAPPQPLGAQEDPPVHDQEHRRRLGLGQRHPQLVFEARDR